MCRPFFVLAVLGVAAIAGCNSTATRRQTSAPKTTSEQRVDLKKSGLTKSDRERWRALLHWSNDCEEAFQATVPDGAGLQFYELAPGKQLVEVACALGAYQGSQEFVLLDETKSQLKATSLEFTTYEAAGPDGQRLEERRTRELAGLAEFSPKTKELTVWNKYRGIGDCGSYATYAIENERAVLKDFRAKLACDEKGSDDPKSWPKLPVKPAAAPSKP